MNEKSTGVLSTVLKVLAVAFTLASAVAIALIIVKKFCKKNACVWTEEDILLDECCCDCDCIEDAECFCCDEAECPVEDAEAVVVAD
jgi:hypothetical protein